VQQVIPAIPLQQWLLQPEGKLSGGAGVALKTSVRITIAPGGAVSWRPAGAATFAIIGVECAVGAECACPACALASDGATQAAIRSAKARARYSNML
jgi:hypothetical protein